MGHHPAVDDHATPAAAASMSLDGCRAVAPSNRTTPKGSAIAPVLAHIALIPHAFPSPYPLRGRRHPGSVARPFVSHHYGWNGREASSPAGTDYELGRRRAYGLRFRGPPGTIGQSGRTCRPGRTCRRRYLSPQSDGGHKSAGAELLRLARSI